MVLFLIVMTMFISCTKTTDPVKALCFPTTISSGTTGVSSTTTYLYNDKNQVTSKTVTSTTGTNTSVVERTFMYDSNDNIVTASESSTTGGNAIINYTYDIAHNLTEENLLEDGIPVYKNVYHYNATLQLTGVEYIRYIGAGSSTTTAAYEYATPVARNPTKTTSGTGNIWRYEYDTKPNPLKVLFVSIQPDNNITRVTYAPTGGTATQTAYTYQYTSNGYPASRTGTDGESTEYSYSCK